MTRLSDLYKAEIRPFSVGDVKYHISVDLDHVQTLEAECGASLGAIGQMIANGHVSVMIRIMAITAKRITEVGPQPVNDLAEIGMLIRSNDAMTALAEALAAVKNVLSPEAQPPPSESGSEPASTRKRSGGSRAGQ
jgi:hypothetical protein